MMIVRFLCDGIKRDGPVRPAGGLSTRPSMLTDQNIEAELSYAYLHAVATRGGFSCSYTHRHLDDVGVDAQVHEDGRLLASDSIHTSFALHVQLKDTRVSPVEQDGRFSFSLPVRQYNGLRETRLASAVSTHSRRSLPARGSLGLADALRRGADRQALCLLGEPLGSAAEHQRRDPNDLRPPAAGPVGRRSHGDHGPLLSG